MPRSRASTQLMRRTDARTRRDAQQFNTTTSMGRLTLNVLLSFAQFEREVTSERIRDKIAASKRKGLWVGGMAPLGYDTKDRKITVNEAEADRVRTIFQSYLKLGSLNLLLEDLRKQGTLTKVRTLKTGQTVGGIPFTRGPLAYLLRNRFYVGEVAFKGETLAGEQPAIVDRDLFDAVQAKLNEQVTNHKVSRTKSEALLLGRIYDDRGHRMTPSHVRKGGIKYRYYISSPHAMVRSERMVGTIWKAAMQPNAFFPSLDIGTDPAKIRDWAQAAEDLGYTYIEVPDHVFGAKGRDGWVPLYNEKDPFHETFVTLGFLAAVTKTI